MYWTKYKNLLISLFKGVQVANRPPTPLMRPPTPLTNDGGPDRARTADPLSPIRVDFDEESAAVSVEPLRFASILLPEKLDRDYGRSGGEKDSVRASESHVIV